VPEYQALQFHQFGSNTDRDLLHLFSAPAREITQWAGVPRKGWRIRMLYQRWITENRELELRDFWDAAGQPKPSEDYIVGPTAVTVALVGAPTITNGRITIQHSIPVDFSKPPLDNLKQLADLILPGIRARLNNLKKVIVDEFSQHLTDPFPDIEHDYVLEFALQLVQMSADPIWFRDHHHVSDLEVDELIKALEAISRPALVIDGQHRVVGAALSAVPVVLPVVAIPNCSWMDQIYQFIVINEKAQRVEGSLLTDIFGSSLTREEQDRLRDRLTRAKVDVEVRIAAVIAGRDPASPFNTMVRLRLQGPPPAGANPYITDLTIRLLIEGGGRDARGWRSDDEFYDEYVKPTFPVRADWENWTSGAWRQYWFTFWRTVATYFDEQAQLLLKDTSIKLWNPTEQTNLTKGVALRLFQRLFMEQAIARMDLRQTKAILDETLGTEKADEILGHKQKELAIPATPELFAHQLRSWFLENGVPVRFFTTPWKRSLDDDEGRAALWYEMSKAYELCSKGERYRVGNRDVFEIRDEEK